MNTFQKSVNDIFSLGGKDILEEIQSGSYLSQSVSEDFYSNIMDDLKRFETLSTKDDISFFNECSLGDEFSSIISKFGKNFYILHKTASNTKVLFMTKNTEKHVTKCEYHFKNNKLFFATYCFTDVSGEYRKGFIKKITAGNTKMSVYGANKAFKDNNNNILIIEDSMMLKVSFFNVQELKQYI